MKLFREMSATESAHWKKGAILGFYTYMLLLFIDHMYYLYFEKNVFSSNMIFWSGLLTAFGLQWVLDLREKMKR
ncbi:hypothetical protein [Peribacillus muralis]|uniref:hypothetical protein n=1 Tax=Peribacillus muralis TaxID=264697 RepID=UPI00070B4E4A|nr:hypothetical protein [Peribacillus muralis]